MVFFARSPVDSNELALELVANAVPRELFHAPGKVLASDFGPPHGYAVLGVRGPTSPDL